MARVRAASQQRLARRRALRARGSRGASGCSRGQRAHLLVVLDQQDRLRAAGNELAIARGAVASMPRSSVARQVDLERRALARARCRPQIVPPLCCTMP